ncbi:MAG: DNA repair protein RecO C-terminal domain-containing protein [Gammaproteobacteria bacterium]
MFAAYLGVLGQLAQTRDLEQVLRTFELELLSQVGFALRLDTEADGVTPVEPGGRYEYRVEQGPVRSAAGGLSGATLLALAQRAPLDAEQRREARTLLRAVLRYQLGGRELRSRELFRGAILK